MIAPPPQFPTAGAFRREDYDRYLTERASVYAKTCLDISRPLPHITAQFPPVSSRRALVTNLIGEQLV